MSSGEKLVFEASNFTDSKQKHAKRINNHYFNHAVSCIVPGAEKIPDEVEQLFNSQPYYVVQNFPIAKLISEEFIEAFIKKGSLYLLTNEQAIDTKSCVALLPTGVLILHVTKDLYQELGLEGHVSKFHAKTKMKYCVRIDVTEPHFQPGRKCFERVKWCLSERLDLNFNCLVTWVPNDDTICPSSIVTYFQSLGLSVSRGEVSKVQHRTKIHSVPVLDSASIDPTQDNCGYLQVYEWFGVVACGCEFGSSEDFVNSLTCPEPNARHKVSHLKLSGFFSTQQIMSAIEFLRDWVQRSSLPWASITVHGFMDSLISWSETEHGYFVNGDNMYTLIVFPNDDYWLYLATGSSDIVS